MKKGYTMQPCPGCGKSNNRKKDSVCPECFSLMETGRMHMDLYEKIAENDSFIEVKIPTNWEKPHYYNYKVIHNHGLHERLGEIMKELVHILSFRKGKRASWSYIRYLENHLTFENVSQAKANTMFKSGYGEQGRYNHSADAVIPKTVYLKLEELHDQIELILKEVEEKSVEYGKNMLSMLNNGDITLEEFYKR